jgi:hypothetical protein
VTSSPTPSNSSAPLTAARTAATACCVPRRDSAAHRRIVLHFLRCADGQSLAGIEHDDAARDLHDQFHVVLDHHHADAGIGDPGQQLREHGLVFARQAGGRFVQQQHIGIGGQRASDFHQAAIDVGQVGAGDIERAAIAAKSSRWRQRARTSPETKPRAEQAAQAAAAAGQRHVVGHREAAEQLRGLVRATPWRAMQAASPAGGVWPSVSWPALGR